VSTSAQGMPDTMYFKRGETAPERVSQRSTNVDVPAPSRMAPVEERTPSAPSPMEDASGPAEGGGSKLPFIIVGVVVLAGAGVAAFFVLT
jgi:hypothetical protein